MLFPAQSIGVDQPTLILPEGSVTMAKIAEYWSTGLSVAVWAIRTI